MRRFFGRRLVYGALVLTTTAAATTWLWTVLLTDGVVGLEWVLLGVFALLFTWIASSFWLACVGAYVLLNRIPACSLASAKPTDGPSRSRTAVVMPLYNEEPGRLFAGIQAIYESVRETGAIDGFDFYLLSDSTEPDQWIAEELEWVRLRQILEPNARVYYRHRPKNVGRKSGNIADFCENWGSLYDYMVVLDADSLMTGPTLVTLVGMMDHNPRVALVQVPPQLVNRDSLLARIQQFSGSVYGPMYAAGLGYLQAADGNYWGHNAIIRIQPFMLHCGLPTLPGKAPLGGEILSHDFVEAALLRRAGWELWMAPELDGSYEEAPPTLIDHLKRDRRWCQGNLQHIRIIFARGLTPISRIHLAIGVMTYVSSPLWLLLLILFTGEAFQHTLIEPVTYVGKYPQLAWPVPHTINIVMLVLATVGLLFIPKLLALFVLVHDRAAVRAHGGDLRAGLSVLLESLFSTLLAPILMLSHSWFVATILLGRTADWRVQQRNDRALPLAAAIRIFAPHTAVALLSGAAAYVFMSDAFWWFAPIIFGLGIAVPLCQIVSRPDTGRTARRWGLFLVPSETRRLPILHRVREFVAEREARSADRLETGDLVRLAVEHPFINAVHATVLAGYSPVDPDRGRLASLLALVRRNGLNCLSKKDQITILSDPESVSILHSDTQSRRLAGGLAH